MMNLLSIDSFRKVISNNLKIIENYFFSVLLQIVGTFIGIAVYPYLIRTLGSNAYGLYVFSSSLTSYFISFISFGFNLPAIKAIAQNKENQELKSTIVSSILTAKVLLATCSTIVYSAIIWLVPSIQNNWAIFTICFAQIVSEVLFPVWYFQGIQKMKYVTVIQLGFRLLTIPLIFLFIKEPYDINTYAIIITASGIGGAIFSLWILKKNESIHFRFISIHLLKNYFRDALPFFWSNSAGTLKQSSVNIIIGMFGGMHDVALYDLANKIILIPRTLTMSINSSIFPKIIDYNPKGMVRKLILYETLISLFIIGTIAVFGNWIILLMGGPAMQNAYPMTVILSFTILVWLVVGCYINFIFVPSGRYYLVTINQLIAFGSFFVFCIIGMYFTNNIISVVIALSLSGLVEIAFCNYLSRKYCLL